MGQAYYLQAVQKSHESGKSTMPKNSLRQMSPKTESLY